MINLTEYIYNIINETNSTGPYTIVWSGGSIAQNDNDNPKWMFKGSSHEPKNLDFEYNSKEEAEKFINKMNNNLEGAYAYKMPYDKKEIWTIVSDSKDIMNKYNKKFNKRLTGGYYNYKYSVVSVQNPIHN